MLNINMATMFAYFIETDSVDKLNRTSAFFARLPFLKMGIKKTADFSHGGVDQRSGFR